MTEGLRERRGVFNSDELARSSRGFNARELFVSSEVKQSQRDRVLEHILKYRCPGEPLHFLGLPGANWCFEKQLQDEWTAPVRFVGFEWNWRTCVRASLNMPGTRSAYDNTEELAEGYVTGFKTDCARLFYSHIGSFLGLNRQDKFLPSDASANKKKKRLARWASLYKSNDAIWLDFTSNLCTETAATLRRVGGHAMAARAFVPLVVTVLIGRDRLSGGFPSRVAKVAALINESRWRSFTVNNAWTYQSEGGATMGMIAGVLSRP